MSHYTKWNELKYYAGFEALFEKHGITLHNFKRFYVEDLSQRDYTLENATPIRLKLPFEIIDETSWGDLIRIAVNLLIKNYPKSNDELLAFKPKGEWTKSAIFTMEARKNDKLLDCGLYLNCNHTAQHACWVLQDLFEFFDVDLGNVELIIHRPCGAEPNEVRRELETYFKGKFKAFLQDIKRKSPAFVNYVVNIIDKNLTPILLSKTRAYNNFFLFDSVQTLVCYCDDVEKVINYQRNFKEDDKKILYKCLNYLREFYRDYIKNCDGTVHKYYFSNKKKINAVE